jgi:hypothetical protein
LEEHVEFQVPTVQDAPANSLDKLWKSITKMQYQDDSLEYMIETHYAEFKEYIQDHDNYAQNKLRDSISAEQLKTLPFPFKTDKKAPMIKELHLFLEKHPWLKTTEFGLLRQRICNHFYVGLYQETQYAPNMSIKDHLNHMMSIRLPSPYQ